MPTVAVEQLNVFLLEQTIWIAAAKVNSPKYDFAFSNFFACQHPFYRPDIITAVGRFGVTDDYSTFYSTLAKQGVFLIHTPHEHFLASELTSWYPLLQDLTPRSICYEKPPTATEIEREFSYPIFIKGNRQTSKHKANLSIVRSRSQYEFAIAEYLKNSILHWQEFVCREFVELRPVLIRQATDKIPPSFEFRTFWWKSEFVGGGSYWADFAAYSWTETEKAAALRIAQEAAN